MCQNKKLNRKEILETLPELACLNIPEEGINSQEHFHQLMREATKTAKILPKELEIH